MFVKCLSLVDKLFLVPKFINSVLFTLSTDAFSRNANNKCKLVNAMVRIFYLSEAYWFFL